MHIITKKGQTFHDIHGVPIEIQMGMLDGRDFPLHTHEFSEIVVIFEGTAVHRMGESDYFAKQGDVFVLKGDDAHGFRDTEHLRFCNVLYRPTEVFAMWPDITRLPGYQALFVVAPAVRVEEGGKSMFTLSAKDVMYVEHLLTIMDTEMKRQEGGYESMVMTYFLQLLTFLSRIYTAEKAPEAKRVMAIADAITYLEEHYTEEMTLEALAERAGLSVNRFLAIFKEHYGTSPMRRVLDLRLTKAAELLRDETRSITEVAYDVGFMDSNYFSRQFKKVLGVTPREYRART